MNRQQILGFLALLPGLAMSFMDQTILPVALPTIQTDFGASNTSLQWAVNSYLLVTAIFVLAAGKLSDRLGHRNTLLLGIFIFAAASLLCGFSSNIGFLIAARGLQGLGAALQFPAQTALLAILFPPDQRGRAAGLMASIGSLFMIFGPLLGGYLTEAASWRYIFWVNLPIAAIGCAMGLFCFPPSKTTNAKIDGYGFSYFAILAATLILLLMQGSDWGWTSDWALSLYAIAAISLALLVRREKKAAHPFLDLGLLKHPIFAAANISVALIQFILMITVFRAIYFQNVLGYTPTETGFLTFITCLPVCFISPVGGYLSDRIGPKWPISIGFWLLIFSFFWFGAFRALTVTHLLISSIPFGFAIPLIFTPSYSTAMSSVPRSKIGVGSGMIATVRTFSATAGVAIIGLALAAVQDHSFLNASPLQSIPPDELFAVSHGTLAIDALPAAIRIDAASALRTAGIAAFSLVHYVLGILVALIFCMVFALHHRHSAHCLPTSPAEGWD